MKSITIHGEWDDALLEAIGEMAKLEQEQQKRLATVITHELEFLKAIPTIERLEEAVKVAGAMTPAQIQQNAALVASRLSPNNPHLIRLQCLVRHGWPMRGTALLT